MCGYSSTITSRCFCLSESKTSWAVSGSLASLPVKRAEAGDELPRLVERSQADQAVLLAEHVVDVAAAGGDVDDARSLAGDDVGVALASRGRRR